MADQPFNPTSLYGAVDLSALANRDARPAPGAQGRAGAGAPGDASADAPGGAPAGAGAPDQNEPVATLPDAVVDVDERLLDQFMQLSQFLPVFVEMHVGWSSEAKEAAPLLASVVRGLGGRAVLARVDLDANPALGQQPQVIAVLGGRPLQLFSGNPGIDQIRALVNEVVQVAAQQGIAGRVAIEGVDPDAPVVEPEPELPPLHREAYDAVERGDYPAGIAAFERAIAENPGDDDARAGLAQVQLLHRLQGRTLDQIRQAAAQGPEDLDAQLAVADLDLSGGHVEDAFDRLLTLFPTLDADGKKTVRERLLDLFRIVGPADPRVAAARARLTNLLY